MECPPIATEQVVDSGTAGGSARQEYERRRDVREARVKQRAGRLLGGLILALTDEPSSIRAWQRGALGESKVGKALAGLPQVSVLHDRRVPGTKANIDHIVISPAGVFVVDAKRYQGLIKVRDIGGLFNTDKRLYVGSRDCTELAQKMDWQVRAVREVLDAASSEHAEVPVVPVLCFVDGEWPLLFPPEEFRGVRLEGTRSIKRLVTRAAVLDAARVQQITKLLGARLPAK